MRVSGLQRSELVRAKSKTPPERTPREIQRQCNERYEELLTEHERRKARQEKINSAPVNMFPCPECGHCVSRDRDGKAPWLCNNKLVIGFGPMFDLGWKQPAENIPALCGLEKALWQPGRRHYWRRVKGFFRSYWVEIAVGFAAGFAGNTYLGHWL